MPSRSAGDELWLSVGNELNLSNILISLCLAPGAFCFPSPFYTWLPALLFATVSFPYTAIY